MIPKWESAKNKVRKSGMFLAPENHHTKHHISPDKNHKLTTFLPA
jgi:hypothetical protein